MNKKQQQKHAIARARERYGLVLTFNDLEQLAQQIQQYPPPEGITFLRKQTLRVSAYRVEVQGTRCDVLYDKHTHAVMTFLSKEGDTDHVDQQEALGVPRARARGRETGPEGRTRAV